MHISKKIKVEQLGLSGEVLNAFSQLAIQVELRDKRRYSVSRSVDQLIGLLNHAQESKSVETNNLYSDLLKILSQETKSVLKAMGAAVSSDHTQLLPENKKSNVDADNRHKFGARS